MKQGLQMNPTLNTHQVMQASLQLNKNANAVAQLYAIYEELYDELPDTSAGFKENIPEVQPPPTFPGSASPKSS